MLLKSFVTIGKTSGIQRRSGRLEHPNVYYIFRSIYLTLIRSLFEHCSQIWRPVKNCDEIKFEALQKKAIKWIFNEDFIQYSIDKYFSKCKQIDIPPLQLHFELNDLIFFIRLLGSLSLLVYQIILFPIWEPLLYEAAI